MTTKPQPSTSSSSPNQGKFTLLLFAAASTYASNTESLTLPAPTTLPSLIDELETRYPGIGEKVLKSCQIVVNLDYVDVDVWDVVQGKMDENGRKRVGEDVVIGVGDEVGVVPPVSSG